MHRHFICISTKALQLKTCSINIDMKVILPIFKLLHHRQFTDTATQIQIMAGIIIRK